MNFELLNKKPKITKNNKEIIDIVSKSIQYNNHDYFIIDSFYVGADLEMRPDLLSNVVYGNNTSWDLLLKFNGISNPFSLAKDDFIMVPELSWMNEQTYENKNNIESDIRSPYIDNTKNTTKDTNKNEYDKLVKILYSVNKNAKFNKDLLPPNMSQQGDSEIKVTDDKIILG